jgi:uncharacterized protein YndB with AHSA1/START domain
MAVLKRTQVIRRPVEEGFELVADACNFADWNPTIRTSRRLDEGETGNGSRFEWELRGFGKVRAGIRGVRAKRAGPNRPAHKADRGWTPLPFHRAGW